MNKTKAAIILAAGKGKRMESELPKVLHKIAGKTMIRFLLETITKMNFDRVYVVIGHQGDLVRKELADFNIEFVWQKEQLGTGHAVMMTEKMMKDFSGTVLVAAGDVPFLSETSIRSLIGVHEDNQSSATCLSAVFDDPTGYGRVIREPGTNRMLEIIEEKDATEEIRKITEINSGTFCFDSVDLFSILYKLKNNNVQKEYYLTDTIGLLRAANKTCAVWTVPDAIEVIGVNSAEQLEKLEKEARIKKILD